jgi:hypothetical protein
MICYFNMQDPPPPAAPNHPMLHILFMQMICTHESLAPVAIDTFSRMIIVILHPPSCLAIMSMSSNTED